MTTCRTSTPISRSPTRLSPGWAGKACSTLRCRTGSPLPRDDNGILMPGVGDDRSVYVSFTPLWRYHYAMTSPPIRQPVRIIGIDPGLRRTGWGVIETEGNRLVFIGCG